MRQHARSERVCTNFTGHLQTGTNQVREPPRGRYAVLVAVMLRSSTSAVRSVAGSQQSEQAQFAGWHTACRVGM